MCENSHDNFSELSYFSGVVLYEWTRMFSVCPSRYLNSLETFLASATFRHGSWKKSPGTRKKGGNERDFSWIRGGVKRMRGANAFIRSVTITQVETGGLEFRLFGKTLGRDSLEQALWTMRRHFFKQGVPSLNNLVIS